MRNNYQQSQDSITRISRSKSRNQMSIVTKLKQKWMERTISFRPNSIIQLPQLASFSMQQVNNVDLKNKFRIPNRKNDPSRAKRFHQPSLQKNKVSNKPNPKKNQEKWRQAITKAYTDLKSLWFQKKIPQCHMEVMTKLFNRQNNTMKILQDIKHQFSQITKETSQIQKILSSIATRQSCLQKIQQLYPELQNDTSTNKSKVGKMFEQKISHLRILTIHCIQCIFQWKQLIQSMGPRSLKVKYIYNGKLYTVKVKQDYKKIIQSKFKEIYKFDTNKIDAFFINYSYDGKKISNVSKNLVKRIRLCQIMLNEQDQNQQQVKRTPLIQKIKTPARNVTENRDKSMPPRGKTPSILPWTKVPLEYGQFADYFSNILSKCQCGSSFLPVIEMSRYDEYTILRYTQTQQQIVIAVQKNASQRKIIVLGLKTNYQGFQAVLKSFCQYIWQHDYCNQIRISLVHQKQVDNFAVDIQLQKKLKLVGFRWVSINHSNQVRLTIYGMKRPLNTVAHKTSRRTQAYPVIIQHLVNFNLSETQQKKQPSRSFPSVLDLIQFISENKEQSYQQICKRDQFSHALSCLNKISQYLRKQAQKQGIKQDFQTTFTYSGLRSFEAENQQKLQKIFRNVQIPTNKSKAPSILSLLNTSFKFNHITIHDGKYTKFFPAKDSQILIVQSNYPIYLLQSDQENISFFVIQVGQGFSMDSVQNIFNSMGEQSSFIDEFWLPTFFKSEDYIDEQGFLNTQLISTNYRNSLGSLSRKSKVRTKIIKAPFVFGMINKKLLQILQIPFYCTLVRKQDLI